MIVRTARQVRSAGRQLRHYGSIRHNAALSVDLAERRDRKTTIICTVGPSSWHRDGLRSLLLRGMNVMRLNFSHGSHDDKTRVISDLRDVVGEFRADPVYHGGGSGQIDFEDGSREDICAIAADTKGPEIRTGLFKDDDGTTTVHIKANSEITLSTQPEDRESGSANKVFVDYGTLADEVQTGQKIFIDDGLLALQVTSADPEQGHVHCHALNDAVLGQQKGVNIPYPFVSNLPSVTEQDKEDLRFAAEQGVDFIFASFIRKAADVEAVRDALGPAGKNVKVISKVENQEGCDNFDEILRSSDGIMVARGDLGIEIPPQQVFLAQKMMIARCNVVGKPVICATQMLESMVTNPRPTRAECSDVANAVLDGADAVMLSGETAKGDYPNEAVEMMSLICREAEVAIDYGALFRDLRRATSQMLATGEQSAFDQRLEAVATSCVVAAAELDAAAIIVLTMSGETAQAVAKYRPGCPVLAVVGSEATAHKVLMSRGVIPLLLSENEMEDSEAALQRGVEALKEMGLVGKNEAPSTGGKKIVAITGQGSGWCVDAVRHLIFM